MIGPEVVGLCHSSTTENISTEKTPLTKTLISLAAPTTPRERSCSKTAAKYSIRDQLPFKYRSYFDFRRTEMLPPAVSV